MMSNDRKRFTITRDELLRLGINVRVGERFVTDYFELVPVIFEVVDLDGQGATIARVGPATGEPAGTYRWHVR